MNNDILKHKELYKTFIVLVKYLPFISMIIQMFALILNYHGISASILSCFGGVSIIFIILLYFISYIFNFCYLYRIPLWYNLVIILTSVLRITGLIPVDIINLYRFYVVISGLFISLFIYLVYKNRNKPKIDYIKQFCERYNCNCK